MRRSTDVIQCPSKFQCPENWINRRLGFHNTVFLSSVPGALSQSQFPVFTIYAQKSCLAVKPCERAWCIDRVQGHRLQGHTRRTMSASSRQHCLELCLGERDFLCRWVSAWLFFVRCIANPIQGMVVFRRPSSFSSSARTRYPPGEGGRSAGPRFFANRHTVYSLPSVSPSSRSSRIEGTSTRSGAFSSYWIPRSREDVTSRFYRLSSVSQSWSDRPRRFMEAGAHQRERAILLEKLQRNSFELDPIPRVFVVLRDGCSPFLFTHQRNAAPILFKYFSRVFRTDSFHRTVFPVVPFASLTRWLRFLRLKTVTLWLS